MKHFFDASVAMTPIRRNHGNEKRAEKRHKCRTSLSNHIYEKLNVVIDPMKVRLRPGPDDPYRWVCVPSTRHLLDKQLSKGSTRDYQDICDAIDNFALEAVPVDGHIQQEGQKDIEANTQFLTQDQFNRPTESFAMRVLQLTAENEILLSAQRTWKKQADKAEAALLSTRGDLENERLLTKELETEVQEHRIKLRESLKIFKQFKEGVENSNQALRSLLEATQASHNKLVVHQ